VKIAILGAGNVGGTLGTAWAARDHDVVFGVREPGAAKVKALVQQAGPRTSAAAVKESGLAVGHTTSGGEEVAGWAAGARVVKAFNTIGAVHMAQPTFRTERASMFLCGDDAAAKGTVSGLARELGFDPVDAGPLAQARLLEPLAMLWISMALVHGHGPNIAFKLLRK